MTDDELFVEEPVPADSLISHSQLQLELDRSKETRENDWSAFLERATTCASTHTPLAHPDAQDELRPFVGKIPIWKVPVKVCKRIYF